MFPPKSKTLLSSVCRSAHWTPRHFSTCFGLSESPSPFSLSFNSIPVASTCQARLDRLKRAGGAGWSATGQRRAGRGHTYLKHSLQTRLKDPTGEIVFTTFGDSCGQKKQKWKDIVVFNDCERYEGFNGEHYAQKSQLCLLLGCLPWIVSVLSRTEWL